MKAVGAFGDVVDVGAGAQHMVAGGAVVDVDVVGAGALMSVPGHSCTRGGRSKIAKSRRG
eukprot:1682994-Rhodomonas_salina.1